MSITSRLILSLSLLITVFWLSAAMIARSVFVEEVDEMLEDTLQGAGSRLLHAATHDRRPDDGAGASLEQDRDWDHDDDHDSEELDDRFDDWDMLSDGRSDYLAFEVRDGQDRLIMRSAGAGELLSERRERSGFFVTDDALLYSIADPASRYSVTVATARSHRDSAIAEATWALFLPMVALLALMAGTTFFLVRLFVTPVKDLSTELSKRGGTNLAPLDRAALPSELRPIAQSANMLMQRLQKAMLPQTDLSFYTVYFAAHGLLHVGIVAALLYGAAWAYGLSIIVLAVFIAYQLFKCAHVGGAMLLVLSAIDLAVILLTTH